MRPIGFQLCFKAISDDFTNQTNQTAGRIAMLDQDEGQAVADRHGIRSPIGTVFNVITVSAPRRYSGADQPQPAYA